ncbi:hypothetical protein [Chamaesiphon polymorphus]|uniref:hypothetical protein n=1 Tax=Chamaesiphon polymorphus TaxID=2107691 RepID=UPI0011B23AF0|nr:hypothetical protein [Chamaesiphon polymorphus]
MAFVIYVAIAIFLSASRFHPKASIDRFCQSSTLVCTQPHLRHHLASTATIGTSPPATNER